ncbi:hypothetical protein [Corynebacterium sp.]|uniref:Gp37-like protein n=1 Tax=Corynebacterium sp. TaxID=1720 RepID=UPI0028A794A5|nr:hypothetical protein [Corynebacterium sp.]
MATNWAQYRAARQTVMRDTGQFVGILDKDWQPVMEIEDWTSFEATASYGETGNLTLELPGSLDNGTANPVTDFLIAADIKDFSDADNLEKLFHESVHIIIERPAGTGKQARRVYRLTGIDAAGGSERPETVTVYGVDLIEHLKHIPLWADPSNHSKVAQLQFSDRQTGTVEEVSRKLIGRNLMGYQQPSMLHQLFDGKAGSWSMTGDYSLPARWTSLQPNMHSVICTPVISGLPSERCFVEARWDNAWDLLKASWDAGGVMPTVDLWLPGDAQPMPDHTTLELPTAIIDFKPRSTVSGAVGLFGQAWRNLARTISEDGFTSVYEFSETTVPTMDGRLPWVVYDFPDVAPEINIRKSTDWRYLVGGKSPKIVNEVMKAGLKTMVAAGLSLIPGIGATAAALINGAADMVAEMSVDRFLNIEEFEDLNRKNWHGRSRYISVMKAGEANSWEARQKAWQAKTETSGGLSTTFAIDGVHPYVPHRDYEIGDTIGFTAWERTWAAYVSGVDWTSDISDPVGFALRVGNLDALKDPEELLSLSIETIRAVTSRLATAVTN